MLLREGPSGTPEVFMMRRALTMAFAAQMMVFPGGAVDPEDSDSGVPFGGVHPTGWANRMAVDGDLAERILVAAVREVFEEVGVLLAAPDDGSPATASSAELDRLRVALVDDRLPLAQVLWAVRHTVRPDDFVVRAHWVTPLFERRRYDTWILAARMPTAQAVADVSGEADHSAWVEAAEVLEAAERGEAFLLPPTQICLEELAEAGEIGAFLAQPAAVPSVMPTLLEREDGEVVLRADLGGDAP
jgi:8-oxo-dGTP pyrophosphatase MutT (NUDIX family)